MNWTKLTALANTLMVAAVIAAPATIATAAPIPISWSADDPPPPPPGCDSPDSACQPPPPPLPPPFEHCCYRRDFVG